ncbi:PTGR2-like protein, partial [Mya arenaria]
SIQAVNINMSNKKIVFASLPGADNEPTVDNFRCEACDPAPSPGDGELTIQTLYISLDPAIRCRMNTDTGVEYMSAWSAGDLVLGLGGVGMVTESNVDQYAPGDLVQPMVNWPWVEKFSARADDKLFTLYKRGHISPGANQTCVVSGAAGATGNLAGQIAKLGGCKRVVGICGSDEKCEHLRTELGFDATVNYKQSDISEALRQTCPNGIDVYFDNVGGTISETVIKQMNPDSHVILCGQIAVYNKDLPYPPPISEEIQAVIKERNITRERFLVLTYQEKFQEGLKQLQEWYMGGQLKVPEFVHEGIESAPEAFVNMMTSVKQTRVGKQLVCVNK